MLRAIRVFVCVVAAVLVPFGETVRGGVTASLPLAGYYRPGRFIPVRISLQTGLGAIEIGALGTAGAVTSIVKNARDGETIVPVLLVLDSVKQLRITGGPTLALKLLGERQRLVAYAGGDPGLAKAVFPESELIPVELDGSRPLLEPEQAWSGIDAAVLSASARARLSDENIGSLLAAGIALIVQEDRRPDERWPWRRINDVWVLRHQAAGPVGAIGSENYAPTYVWDRGLPPAIRTQILLEAAAFSILALGVLLWRPKRMIGFFSLLCVAGGALVWAGHLRRPAELELNAAVIVRAKDLTQTDDWTWRSPLGNAEMSHPADGLTVPVFASAAQLEQSAIRLQCDPDGRPIRFDFRLGRNQTLAFVTRRVGLTIPVKSLAPIAGVWKDFAVDLYARPGDSIGGAATSVSQEASPVVVVNRADGR